MATPYIGSGLGGQLGIAEEATVWNGSTVPQTEDHFYEFESESLQAHKKVVQAEGIRAGGLYDRVAGRFVTQRWAAGDINLNFPTKKAGLLLRHMLGAPCVRPTQVGATAAYTSVFTPGNTLGMSLAVREGINPTAGSTTEPFAYPGSKITDWELSCAQSDLLKLKVTLDCMDELTAGTTPAAGSVASASYALASFFTFAQGTLKQGGTVNTVSTPAPTTPTQNAAATATTGGTIAAGTSYMKVAAVNAVGETIASTEQSVVTTGSTSTVTANWTTVANATGYKVYYGTSAGAENVYATAGAAATSLVLTAAPTTAGTPLSTATATATTVTSISGGTVVGYVRAIKITGKNGLKVDNFFLGSGTTKAEQNINAYRGLTVSADIEFGSRALYDLYRSDTSGALELTFTGPNIPSTSTPVSLDVVLPAAFIEDGISPTISGPDVVMMTAPFTVLSNDVDPAIQITYTSADTAL